MNYWLMKNEPEAYSIDDLARDGVGRWDGIRNYQVRNMLRDEFTIDDLAIFYYSNAGAKTGAVGVMEVASAAYTDPLQFEPASKYYDERSLKENPRWLCVDVRFKEVFQKPVLLPEMRTDKALKTLQILKRGNRLSVTRLNKKEFERLVALGNVLPA
jgi:predicted RNA-binding protein with PUA-like domain